MAPTILKTTPRLSRRTLLRGAGSVAIGLPLLEAMLPGRRAHAQGGDPKRFLAFYVPCGIHMASWTPTAEGAGFDLPPILAPLAALQSKIMPISGLANIPAKPDGPGGHAGGTSGFLTCTHVLKSESEIRNEISMDQIFANAKGGETRLPSLQLGIEGGNNAGGCDSGYSCAYTRNISWAGPVSPLPKVTDPQLAFDLLFGGSDPNASAEAQALHRARRTSVLDVVRDQANRLSATLGAGDREKLDAYLTGVRDLETRIDGEASQPVCDTTGVETEYTDLPSHVQRMLDVVVMALRCDLTRAITFMLANGASERAFPFLGVSGTHHQLSHHQNDPAKLQILETINRWEVEQLAYLLTAMDGIMEQDGTLLDNSIVYFCSEIEDGNMHRQVNLPVLVGGGGGGTLDTGRHVRVADGTPLANLFMTLLGALDVSVPSFGDDSTGPLGGITR